MKTNRIYLPDVIGKGYRKFWQFRGRYRVVKGSRASKKSKTTALWYIYNLMKYKDANLLVVRKTFRTLKDSCYTELKWAVNRLQVSHLWQFKETPLEATYKPTGQKIYFRGLDDPLKVASITVEQGYLCWLWIEEAYEISNEKDFDTLDESIRGAVPDRLFKQVTLTLNPWNERHWIKRRFFDADSSDILAMTTDYRINEWLGEEDLKLFDDMKKRNPRRYQVAGLGRWGVTEGLIYENWKEARFRLDQMPAGAVTVCGLDYGYTNDPSAFLVAFLDVSGRVLYVWDEIYQKGMSNRRIYDEITKAGYGKERIIADSAEPKSNAELRGYGLRIHAAKKGKDSILNGIQWIQDLEIIVHPRCVNFLSEISNYGFEQDRFGNYINQPVDEFNHLMDAMRYALGPYMRSWQKIDVDQQLKAMKALGL